VIYTVQDNDSINIFLVDIAGRNEDQLTFDGKSNAPCFSSDGTKIIYSSFLNNKYQPEIWEMNYDKTNKVKLTKDGGVSPVWLYQILAAPVAANTAVPSPVIKPKQEAIFDVKETTSNAAGSSATPVIREKTTANAPEGLKVSTVQQGNKLLFYPVIHYDLSLSNIKPEFKPALDDMANIIKLNDSPIIIEGHTDNTPIKTKKFPSNYELSIARAESVKDYLVKKDGIPASRITVTGLGDTKPSVPNDSESNKYINRRSEIMVISVVSEPITEPAVKVTMKTSQPARERALVNTPAAVTASASPAAVTLTAAVSAVTPETASPIKVEMKRGNSSKSISW
jgi:flagellar motor protein MotB